MIPKALGKLENFYEYEIDIVDILKVDDLISCQGQLLMHPLIGHSL